MAFTPQRFVHVGFGNMICANRVETILVPMAASARRLSKAAKEAGAYLDLTAGRVTKALILMDNGKVYGCALMPRTIAERIASIQNDEGDADDENSIPEREDFESD